MSLEGIAVFLFKSFRINHFSAKYTEKYIVFIIPDLRIEFAK